jgi:AraC-like DNA-binding protein
MKPLTPIYVKGSLPWNKLSNAHFMSFAAKYVSVDNPKIPVLSSSQSNQIPYGKFITNSVSSSEAFDEVMTTVKTYDMYVPNFSLRLYEGKVLKNAAFSNQTGAGADLLGSCLFLKGNVKSQLRGMQEGPRSFNWSQNFKFDPNNEFVHICEANSELHFLHLSYTADYFTQFLPDEHWSDRLKNQIAKRERIIGENFSAITPAQEQALKNILNCPMDGKLGYMMIETSLIQIILIQMHTLFYKEEAFKQPIANRRDIEIIQQLREYLTKTFLEDHCLSTLAKQFGTNTNKLMSLFKKVFGKSIFEFIGELRMEHAMELLREQGLLVTEVARMVGYKNPNHFSCAFKRRFGISPSDLR